MQSRRGLWLVAAVISVTVLVNEVTLAYGADLCVAPPEAPPAPFEDSVWAASAARLSKIDAAAGAAVEEITVAGAMAMAIDEARQKVWTVDSFRTVRAYDLEGALLTSFAGPAADPICGLLGYAGRQHLAVDARDGSLWVGDCTKLHHYSGTGALLGESNLTGKIRGIAIDAERGLRWTATDLALKAHDDAGTEIASVTAEPLAPFVDMDLDAASGDVWAAISGVVGGSAIRSYTPAGVLRFVVPMDEVASVVSDDAGGAWAAGGATLVRIDPAGVVVASAEPFGASGIVAALIADHQDGTVWATNGTALIHLDASAVQDRSATVGAISGIGVLEFYADRIPPEAEIMDPSEGALLNTTRPSIGLQATDDASGIDVSGICVSSAGEPLEASCVETVDGADCSVGEDLPQGGNTLSVVVFDRNGNRSETATVTVAIDSLSPPGVDRDRLSLSTQDGVTTITGSAGSAEGGATIRVTNMRTGETVNATANPDGSFTLGIAANPGDELSIVAIDSASNPSSPLVIRAPGEDPAAVAPPIDPTTPTDFAAALAFLYTGADAVQIGVAPGTISARRVGVIRGRALERSGDGIPGVEASVVGHPEYGVTYTRSDGGFDLAVNGGGVVTVELRHPGYVRSQRQIAVPWRDFAVLPDVVLVPFDPVVTTVDLASSAAVQVARGSVSADGHGSRQATVLFPQGTGASFVMPDGSTQIASTLSVRATEFTVGSAGPKAMPAPLPPASGYTYALELSVDEAEAAGAFEVRFTQALPFYVENFLNFPVGMKVPLGYYDRQKSAWVAAPNGRVVKILSVSGGLAEIDADGNGSADSASALAALGVTEAERVSLAGIYASGTTLWRAPITHFTPWDCNWPYNAPNGASGSTAGPPGSDGSTDSPTKQCGSIIECESQVLGERVDLAGTPHHLRYQSDRVRGRAAAYTLDIPLSGATIPTNLKRIDLEVSVAGRTVNQSFPAAANQATTFTWDGLDAYGRPMPGRQAAKVRVGFVYDAVYQQPANFERSFGEFSGIPLTANPARQEVTLWSERSAAVGVFEAIGQGLGGWTLDVHHAYDAATRELYLGDGRRRSASTIANTIRSVVAGMNVGNPTDVAVRSDGAVFFATTASWGGGVYRLLNGQVQQVYAPGGPIAFSPDDVLHVAINNRVYRVAANGAATAVVGTAQACDRYTTPPAWPTCGDGGSALAAGFAEIIAIDFGPDGSLYLLQGAFSDNRIRRVSPGGIVTAFAGDPNGSSADNVRATQAKLDNCQDMSVGPDGAVYVPEGNTKRVRRIGTNGLIRTIAGTGVEGYTGDGGPGTSARVANVHRVDVAADGAVYVSDFDYHVVRRIGPDGVITTVAGAGSSGFAGDGGPAVTAKFLLANGVATGPDGSLFIADQGNARIRQVSTPLPGYTGGEILIPSEDASVVYVFNAAGRHLRTVHALTAATLLTFEYDTAGRLAGVRDGSNNVTAIERAGDNPSGIVAPFGQRTALGSDANGYLSGITNPNQDTTSFDYDDSGLMIGMEDANGNDSFIFSYDELGRLDLDQDPAGGSQEFSRQALSSPARGHEVTRLTAGGRSTRYKVEALSTGHREQTIVAPEGTSKKLTVSPAAVSTWVLPSGTIDANSSGPDPRYGLQAPIPASRTVMQPSLLASTTTLTRAVSLANPANPLSVTSLTNTLKVNGRTFTSAYSASTKRFTLTSPAARQSFSTVDVQGRLIETQVGSLEKTTYAYDTRGRLQTVSRGTGADERTFTLAYHPTSGFLTSVTDPLGRVTSYSRDLIGHVTSQTLPGNRTVGFTYDPNGNLASLTPPGRTAHSFLYTPVNLTSAYDPPDVGGPDGTVYSHSLDRDLELVTRPDGQTIDLVYGAMNGRLSSIVTPRGATAFGYHATTGKLTSISAPGNQNLAYTYDGSLLLSETWSGTVAGSVSRTYDTSFRVSNFSVNGANPISFAYDGDDLLTAAGSETITRHSQHGLVTATTLGAVADSWSYNGFGELSSYTATANGAPIYSASYTRDKLGRMVTKTETLDLTTDTYTYHYDPAGRLESVDQNGVEVSRYTYDENGNRESYVGPLGSITEVETSYDVQDRLATYGDATYTYTANGELATKTNDSGTTTYAYDVFGNLIEVELPDGTDIEYVIDGRHRRVGKKVNGAFAQRFLYLGELQPIAEFDAAGNLVARFIYGSRPNVPDYMVRAGAIYRIISDHLGSPRLIVDSASGAIVQELSYDEFGNVIGDTNPGFQPFGFGGGIYDPHTKLVRFGARDYDAAIGRWTAKDPILFEGGAANLFAYAAHDPINLIDPNGAAPWLVGAAAGAAINGYMTGTWEGAAAGALLGLTAGLPISPIVMAPLAGGATPILNSLISGSGMPPLSEILSQALLGGLLGAPLSYAGGQIANSYGAHAMPGMGPLGDFLEAFGASMGGILGGNLGHIFDVMGVPDADASESASSGVGCW